MKIKILILGGFGFMGKNLNETFKNDPNYEIINHSRSTNCDLTNFKQIYEKLINISPAVIIYAAAHVGSLSYVSDYSADVVHDNTLMYINLYKAVSLYERTTNKRIIIINPLSNCSYPGIIDVQNETDWWNGKVHESIEAYGVPKKMGFIMSECYKKQYGVKTINLLIPNSYGPNDYVDERRTHAMNGIILRMINAQNNNDKTFSVWGSGKPIREWIYMPDVARIIKKIIDNKMFDLPNPINLGQEHGISINESVVMITDALNYDVTIKRDLSKQDGAPIKVLGNTLFKEHFPNFKFTEFPEGINNTINYYKNIL